MLEKLGEALKKTTDRIANVIFLKKEVVDGVVRELQRSLIEADVNVMLVKRLSDKIRKAAFDERIKGVEKKEHMIKLLHDELLNILGEYKPLTLSEGQNRIMFLGLYGVGKTTTVSKLGNYFAKRGKKVALVGLDVHRPAASEQLKQMAEKNGLKCFIDQKERNPMKIWRENKGKLKDYDLILIDTAGRHMLDEELLEEIKSLKRLIEPTETVLVMPADVGQAAKKQADDFMESAGVSGVIITRMDSSAKGGGALTACAETGAGVFFVATGEKINDLEEFNPERFLSRLLGMGDLQSLLEKIKSAADENGQEAMQKRIEDGKLTMDDVIEQIKSMNSLGGFEKIKGMIPGFSNAGNKISDDVIENQQAKIARWEHIIKSMTPKEKENPELMKKQTSRFQRIARGSGVATSEVRALLKQYEMISEMIKSQSSADFSEGISQKQVQRMMKKFGKMRKYLK